MGTSGPRHILTDRDGGHLASVSRTEGFRGLATRVLHPAYAAGPLDARSLGHVVSSVADALVSGGVDFESLLRYRGSAPGPDGGRAYARLVGAPHLELWLIEWGPSTFLDLHDHGGAIGAIRMLSGNLVETFTDLTSRSRLRSRVLGAGDGTAFAADHVHEIWNASGDKALSLHGYTPRLARMTFYDHSELAYLTPIRSEVFVQERHATKERRIERELALL